jgi:hypothetical protein
VVNGRISETATKRTLYYSLPSASTSPLGVATCRERIAGENFRFTRLAVPAVRTSEIIYVDGTFEGDG